MASQESAVPAPSVTPTPGDAQNNQNRKRGAGQGNRSFKKQKQKPKRERNMSEGSTEEVLLADIEALQKSLEDASPEGAAEAPALPEAGSEIDVKVLQLSSTGDGLAVLEPSTRIYVVPFVAPGDVARVKVYRHLDDGYSVADFLSITTPSPLRDDSRIKCGYFSQCSGCQFQMLSYDEQLRHKRTIVEKAYRNFSQLPPELVPSVADTIGSPLQYGYRTKLTPHFDGPPGHHPSRKKALQKPFEGVPDIGFMRKGKRKVIDIEDCPIGTPAVRKGLTRERARMQTEFGNYSRGATILLRESTDRRAKGDAPDPVPADVEVVEGEDHVDVKTCVTDNNATTTEYIGSQVFTNPAGSFFQNNNSILPRFTDYIRSHILPPASAAGEEIKYLIDAYSGSGLFTISLASNFTSSIGIDIADKSITYARTNASLNGLDTEKCTFLSADANALFASVKFPAQQTVVVLDPPRKGCDGNFLRQLLKFGARRVVYVSCNVHTQARDVGVLVRGEEGPGGARYEIESLVGFDFFPQTGHVEGVAVLNRVEAEKSA
ncbi:related to endo-exonuclease yNucR [Cephalotrichum gorgonifer]|uniref:tRNA (uracil(54)-C(5))-methyltransferase n=1 Tax=Cephalotrichum gorgonifer TaxID=2041049 RepID=A0AAE8SWR3_9PEZI|nr:related to endo-exonuclease yNucR [Cephalotrichum gorgonifer]